MFNYIKQLPPNEELSLKQLSQKALFLLISACIFRVSSVSSLGPTVKVFEVSSRFNWLCTHQLFQDHCIIDLLSLEKHSRSSNVRGYLSVKKFHEDPSLCPVEALVSYSNKVTTVPYDCLFTNWRIFRLYSWMPTDHPSLCLIVGHMLQSRPKLFQDGSFVFWRLRVWIRASGRPILVVPLLLVSWESICPTWSFSDWQTGQRQALCTGCSMIDIIDSMCFFSHFYLISAEI